MQKVHSKGFSCNPCPPRKGPSAVQSVSSLMWFERSCIFFPLFIQILIHHEYCFSLCFYHKTVYLGGISKVRHKKTLSSLRLLCRTSHNLLTGPLLINTKWSEWSCSFTSDSLQPHGLRPTRFLHPWDFPGKNTGVGCHCLPCHLRHTGSETLRAFQSALRGSLSQGNTWESQLQVICILGLLDC